MAISLCAVTLSMSPNYRYSGGTSKLFVRLQPYHSTKVALFDYTSLTVSLRVMKMAGTLTVSLPVGCTRKCTPFVSRTARELTVRSPFTSMVW